VDLSDENPTITVGTSTSSYSSKTDVDDSDIRFNYLFGKKVFPSKATYPMNRATGTKSVTYNDSDDRFSTNSNLFGVEFDYFGDSLEIATYQPPTDRRIYLEIDGKLLNTTGISPLIGTNLEHYIKIEFDTIKTRTIRFYSAGLMAFYGVAHPKVGILSASFNKLENVGIILGDSFTEGANATKEINQFSFLLGKKMNNLNLVSSGSGGTGYLATNSNNRYKLFDRLDKDAQYPIGGVTRPLFYLLCMGFNDKSLNLTDVRVEVAACFAKIRAYNEDIPMFVCGSFSAGENTSLTQPISDIISDELSSVTNSHFIDTSDWITGTGRIGNLQADGIADVVTDTDGTHPTDIGHSYYANKIYKAIKEIVKYY